MARGLDLTLRLRGLSSRRDAKGDKERVRSRLSRGSHVEERIGSPGSPCALAALFIMPAPFFPLPPGDAWQLSRLAKQFPGVPVRVRESSPPLARGPKNPSCVSDHTVVTGTDKLRPAMRTPRPRSPARPPTCLSTHSLVSLWTLGRRGARRHRPWRRCGWGEE